MRTNHDPDADPEVIIPETQFPEIVDAAIAELEKKKVNTNSMTFENMRRVQEMLDSATDEDGRLLGDPNSRVAVLYRALEPDTAEQLTPSKVDEVMKRTRKMVELIGLFIKGEAPMFGTDFEELSGYLQGLGNAYQNRVERDAA